jgi:hypothetical protein
MKQRSNSRRSRGRGVGKHQPKNSNFDSNGPEVRVRGSAQQVYEKYLTLARDAMTVDDRIASENYFQHAEHYYRILGAQESGDGRDGNRDGGPNDGRGRRGRGQPPLGSDLAGAEQPSVEIPAQSGEAVPEEANQPSPETGQPPEQTTEQTPEQTPEQAPEPAEATVERTGAAAAAEAAASDGETDATSGDDDGPRDSAVA